MSRDALRSTGAGTMLVFAREDLQVLLCVRSAPVEPQKERIHRPLQVTQNEGEFALRTEKYVTLVWLIRK